MSKVQQTLLPIKLLGGHQMTQEFVPSLGASPINLGWLLVWMMAAHELAAVGTLELAERLDSYYGSEFISANMSEYCQRKRITFTRLRPYRKNDNCYVEQKSYTMVHRQVGYQRLTGHEQLALVNELYWHLRNVSIEMRHPFVEFSVAIPCLKTRLAAD